MLAGHISVAMMAQFELILGLWDKVKINLTYFSGHIFTYFDIFSVAMVALVSAAPQFQGDSSNAIILQEQRLILHLLLLLLLLLLLCC